MAERPLGRAIWSGTITFGLVSVPVELYAAQRARAVSLRMLDRDGTPLRREYYCPEHDQPVTSEEIVRGYETPDGQMVVVQDEELEALQPRKSRDIDLVQFVRAEELPPMLFQRAYFLAPAAETSAKPYRLLASTMEESGRVGLATFVMRGKSYLVAILAENGVLRAETLRYADELRSAEEVGLEEIADAPAKEVRRIRDRIAKHTADAIDEDELRDEWAEQVERLAEEKRARDQDVVTLTPEAEERTDLLDIMAVLKERLGVQESK